jgi:protoporphyrinogen oxidase
MGRFFPHADLESIIRNMKVPENAGYNATFTYPSGGAIQYVKAIASAVDPARISTGEPLVSVDLRHKVARTTTRELRFERLVSSAPFVRLLEMSQLEHDASAFSWNKVLVYNLGFDKKGRRDVPWVYYPDPSVAFYRIGYYDNIFDSDRLSLYIELGFARDHVVDAEALLPRVLHDLRSVGAITDHRLVASHWVVMDPAYVHITRASMAEYRRLSRVFSANGVYSIGRYGGWSYCSIEDNIIEARALARDFSV